jgi:predicted anti-sigma-YlaC factor YlaD
MNRDRFEKWLRNIYETQDEEISCTECFDRVSRFVELEVSGQDAAANLPEVKQHLDQCSACRDEYETLRDLRRLEEEGGIPFSDDLQDLIH